MILYRIKRDSEGTPSYPSWLEGGQDLCLCESSQHRIAGLGPPFQIGEHPDQEWVGVDDGWQALRCFPHYPMVSARKVSWAKTRLVADAEGRQWQVPIILTAHGNRAIIASYGADWLPAFTPQQKRMLEVAEAARAALEARHVPLQEGCQWAAEALEVGHHLTIKTVQKTKILDDHFIMNILLAMTGALDAVDIAGAA